MSFSPLVRYGLTLLLYHGLFLLFPRISYKLSFWALITLPSLLLLAAALIPGQGSLPLARLIDGGGRRRAMAVYSLAAICLVFLFAAFWPASGLALRGGDKVRAVLLISLIPLAEELFFRGAMLQWASERMGPALGSLLVTCLFGLLHLPQGIAVATTATLLSAALCASVLTSGSVIWAVLFHLGWNTLAVLRPGPPPGDRWFIAGLAAALMVGLIVVGLVGRPTPRSPSPTGRG